MKIFSASIVSLLMIFQTVAFAATGTFSASGEYLMSDYDTPEIAEEIALDFAKQNAAEQAGIYLESYSRTVDFQLEQDEIKTVASSKVEVLTKNITRQPQSNGRVLLRAEITASVDTSELDNFLAQAHEQRQAAIQRYKVIQDMNANIKRDIDALQVKLAAIKDDVADEDLLVEQERINREFLSKQKLLEFAYNPLKNKEVKYDITRIKYDMTLIDEAIKFNPKNMSAHLMQSIFASQSSSDINNINKALLLNSDPKIAAILYSWRAVQYAKKGDLNRAMEDCNKAIQLDPKGSANYTIRAGFYQNVLKDYDKALVDYTTAIKLNPKDIKIYEYRSKLYEFQKKYPEAIKDCKTILKLASEKSDDYYQKIGNMYKEQKDYSHAIEYYTKAINLEPKRAFADHRIAAYLSRAMIYIEQKDCDKAIADCDTGIALAKSALGKINKTGLDSLLIDTNNFMISTFELTKRRALEAKQGLLDAKNVTNRNIDTDNIDALMARAATYRDAFNKDHNNEHLNLAIKDYTKILKLDSKNQPALYERAWAYCLMSEYTSALTDFGALIKLDPNYRYGIVYHSRGWVYEQLGEWNKALADYDKAIELNPKNETAKKNRQRVLDAMKK